jgi:outer membrane protein assembly factor BamB
LSGCSLFSSKKDPNPPAPLVEFTQKMRAQAAWTVSVGKAGSYQFSPAFASGSVFAAANDGTVVRINAQNGQTLWRSRAEGNLTAGVGSDGSTVVVVGEKGRIQAFDAASGKPPGVPRPQRSAVGPAVGRPGGRAQHRQPRDGV